MTFTPDRQAAALFHAIGRTIEQIPPASVWLGVRSPHPHASHAQPPEGTLPHGLDRVTDDWETGQIRTAQGLLDILGEIADEWAEKLGYTTPTRGIPTWLAEHATHAYKALDADTWASSMREAQRVYDRAQTLAGLDPEKTGVTCPHDGAPIIRYITDTGFTDWTICTSCGTLWKPGLYETSRADTIRERLHPDTLITPRDAVSLGYNANTIWSRIRRGQLPTVRIGGQLMIRHGDIACESGENRAQ